jgi:rod shape-determining protein MreC
MAANADIENGDVAVTSGLDGLYPEGLPVGRVEVVERAAKDQFARIVLTPAAGVENHTHLLVLLVEASKRPAPPQPASSAPVPRRSGSRR